jgi:hypothetical protein
MTKLFPTALFSLLTACGDKDGDTGFSICTAEIIFSVNVKIFDEAGQPIEDASPTYSVEGGAEGTCESDGIGGHNCGEDQEGSFTVYVSVDGYEDAEDTVTVSGDECHVTTESMEFQLVLSASGEE